MNTDSGIAHVELRVGSLPPLPGIRKGGQQGGTMKGNTSAATRPLFSSEIDKVKCQEPVECSCWYIALYNAALLITRAQGTTPLRTAQAPDDTRHPNPHTGERSKYEELLFR